MTFQQYVERAEIEYRATRIDGVRRGQAYFNVLNEERPDIGQMARGHIFDPFYKDENIPQFLKFVKDAW